ncbi:MAG: CRISPR-associated endonuclease Cas1 [Desulfurococcus sp.]|uniref:CRISPR-associated endonuclease Cas1 n=1 Tax=Desulfurococcus sp. TaxID=51678 RepID=UPI00317146E1
MRTIFVKNAELVTRKSRSSLIIHRRDGSYREVNIRDIEAVVILGAATKIECGVISLLSRYNIPLSIVNRLGVSILAVPVVTLYNETRRAQYLLSDAEKTEIMLEILKAKFRGFSNILKYHEKEVPEAVLEEAVAERDLLHWEAATSRRYWQLMIDLIPGSILRELKDRYEFQGRRPRAKDPFNQSISALYAILYSLSTRALLASGLDPTYGLHHRTRYSLPLVYDYTEMYKPIAIHTLIKVLRKTEKLPQLDEDGYLTKESMSTMMKELFNTLNARIRRTRITPHRAIYINAIKLATRIRTRNKQIHYTYTYNPKKLQHTKTTDKQW